MKWLLYVCTCEQSEPSVIPTKDLEHYLILDGLVVRLLQPGAHEHAVVIVTQRAQQRGGGVGRVIRQRELGHQLSQESVVAACRRRRAIQITPQGQ